MNTSPSDDEDDDPFNQKYLKVQKLAQGTYGIVWKARNTQNGQHVAIKIFKNLSHEGMPVSAIREINVIKNIKSDYILKPIELNITKKSISMVTQWKQLSLNKLIKSSSPFNVKQIFKQMLNGVQSIHDNFVMHRDLKPANIVLDHGDIINLKIIDFGTAKEIKWNKTIPLTNEVGTLYYRAPELLDGATFYTKAIDLWAIGCIFYELLTQKILFKGDNQAQQLILIYENICNEEDEHNFLKNHPQIGKIHRNYWKNIEQHLKQINIGQNQLDLLKKFLTIEPTTRISCKDALTHSYFIQ